MLGKNKSNILEMAIAMVMALNCTPVRAFIPLPDANGQYAVDEEGNLLVGQMSIGNFPAFDQGGSFEGSPELNQMLGYDPTRSWSAGARPEDVLTYGDFKQYKLHELSIEELNPDTNPRTISLEELDILEGRDLNELIETIPNLGNQKIKDVPPLKDILPEYLHDYSLDRVVHKNTEMVEAIERDAKAEVSQLAQELLTQQQEFIFDGIDEGIEYVSQRIVNNYLQNYPELKEADLEAIAATAKQEVKQELTALASQSGVDFVDDLNLNNPGSYVEQQVAQYSAKLDLLVENASGELEQKILGEINNGLAEAGLEELTSISTNVEDIEQAVKEHGQELLGHAKTQITQKIAEKVGEIEELKRVIPDDIGEIELANYDLSDYSLTDVPGLEDVEVKEFENYEQAAISAIPGAENLSFDRYPFKFNFGAGIATIDWVFSEAEGYANRAISGSIKETFNIAYCGQHNNLNGGCAHVELITPRNMEFLGFNSGKQWVSGDSQETKGGRNLLQNFKGGKEPTGRLPAPESPVKMVLRNNDELKDTTDLYLAFQFCMTDMFGTRHCTPHNVVEIYLMTFEQGDNIFLGISPI